MAKRKGDRIADNWAREKKAEHVARDCAAVEIAADDGNDPGVRGTGPVTLGEVEPHWTVALESESPGALRYLIAEAMTENGALSWPISSRLIDSPEVRAREAGLRRALAAMLPEAARPKEK
jgi:hypothetical protein